MGRHDLNGVGLDNSRNYVWDSTVLGWVAMTQPPGGPGSSAVSPGSTAFALNAGFHFDTSGSLLTAGGAGGSSAVSPGSTSFAANAGFHFNSSGELNIAGSFSASTTVNVSSLGGVVAMRPSDTNWASTAGFHFDSSGALQVAGTFSASTTVNVSSVSGTVTIAGVVTQGNPPWDVSLQTVGSTGGNVTVGDPVNNAIKVNVVAGAAGGSTIVTVSTGSVRVGQSTAADLQATVTQASTVWAVQLTQYSTTTQVSSVGGVVTIQGNSTVRIADSAGNLLESSTSAPSSGARGLFTRQIMPGLQSFATSTAFNNSTAITLVSSAAAARGFVYGYSITSTITSPQQIGFYSGSTLLWSVLLQATSSAISGANLIVTPPAFIFAGSTGQALTVNVPSSNSGLTLSVAYWVST